MAAHPTNQVGVPAKLLKEFVERKVIVDSSTGEMFVGTLMEAEDNMNMALSSVKVTFPSGHQAEMKSVYVKGAKVRYIGLPPEAKLSVSFLVEQSKPRGRGGFRGGRGGRGGGGGRSFDRRR